MWSEVSKDGTVSEKVSESLDTLKKELSPVVEKEASSGAKAFETINFTPVLSPNNYEAEFAIKEDDLIFHIWPWKYHETEERGVQTPRFRKDFEEKLNRSFGSVFFSKWEYEFNEEMGSYFIRAPGSGSNMFAKENAIECLENLHKEMS